jgi:chemotaxis receptor (MCP) glutamine deamidase CheD
MIDADPTTEIRVKVADCAVAVMSKRSSRSALGRASRSLYDNVARVGGLAHTLTRRIHGARPLNPASSPGRRSRCCSLK